MFFIIGNCGNYRFHGHFFNPKYYTSKDNNEIFITDITKLINLIYPTL